MKDAPAAEEAAPNTVSNGVLRITWKNLESERYIPRPGVEYEVADGCIRTLKRPFYDVEKAASELMNAENQVQLDVNAPDYSPALRLKTLEIITTGDPLPEGYKGVDMDVVGRAIVDFFTFRRFKEAKPPA